MAKARPTPLFDLEPSAPVVAQPAETAGNAKRPTKRTKGKKYPGALYLTDIKDDIASMEHPLFALQAGDRRVRIYERNGVRVTIMPGSDGCATIHDKDLWLYCISLLTAQLNQGLAISPTLKFTAYDFMKATGRDTSGRAYERISDMMRRLKGTVVETNIATMGKRARAGFGLIDSWQVVERDDNDRMVAIEATLPAWLFRSVEAMQVLTLSPDYFQIRKPLDRRIYELARKHCGTQPSWRVSLATLHEKSGSTLTLKRFRFEVRELIARNTLPDYRATFDAGPDMVMFHRKGQTELFELLAGSPLNTTADEAATPPVAAS